MTFVKVEYIIINMDITYLNDLEPMDFYEAIIELSDADSHPEIRQDENIVHGCQSRVWVILQEDNIVFDSDSAFVKGLLTAITAELKTLNDIQNVAMENYEFLNVDKVTFQRLKGVDSFMTRLRELSTR